MSTNVIIPPDSSLYDSLQKMVAQRDAVFFAGLPTVGKSFLLQQLTLIAHESGRVVHSLQWGVARRAFRTPDLLARYPDINGQTHPAIRKAVGLCARDGVRQWHEQYAFRNEQQLLIGEVPLVGNRLVELVQKREDAIESFLASPQTLFVIPVPSRTVRQTIEAARERTIAQPQHERESGDAPPSVSRALWQDVYDLAHRLGIAEQAAEQPPYNPDLYASIYQHLLQHRQVETLLIDTILPKKSSVYDLDVIGGEVVPSENDVQRIIAQIEAQYASRQEVLEREVAQWYQV